MIDTEITIWEASMAKYRKKETPMTNLQNQLSAWHWDQSHPLVQTSSQMCFHPQMTGQTPNTRVPLHLLPSSRTKAVNFRYEQNISAKDRKYLRKRLKGIQITDLPPRLFFLLMPIERNLLRTHLDTIACKKSSITRASEIRVMLPAPYMASKSSLHKYT
jgi:hypothetical protein